MTAAAPLPARPKLITFDTYGTLIDWDTALRDYLQSLFDARDLKIDLASFYSDWYYLHALPTLSADFMLYRDLLKTTMRRALAAVSVTFKEEELDALGDVMAAANPFPDTLEILSELRRHVRLATISNSQKDILDLSAQKMGNPFTYQITGEVVQAYKPARPLFDLVLERAGVQPHETVHIAQSQFVDLPRSVPMGIPTIWINRQGQTLLPEHPAPTLELPDLRDVPRVLGFTSASEGTDRDV
ncbi:HAD-IA family hydrolase [Streptomyces hygroscopicus subsp. hygroscopicus]|uniref:HAD-IA family hydrolase n=1 Tax=Streptomyces TaxID=1883 RepID=UPI001C658D16|nr:MULTISPECIES: HAD-IA family hydrolase [Streptomyces]MBW8088883.1 HAD-IA family hydrolase [Streptomyces hygroscopicus subsp. hygroscopicus]MCO8308405.1 HAD-IA family hydrolase [Streptomyces sp. RKCA744]